jgi:hypothetical protein
MISVVDDEADLCRGLAERAVGIGGAFLSMSRLTILFVLLWRIHTVLFD